MKRSTIAALGVFAILVILILLLPSAQKQHMQGALFALVSPVLRTGAAIREQLGGVSGGLKRLDELERDNKMLKLDNEQLRASNSLLQNLQAEVNRLNRALGYRERSAFRLIPARIIVRANSTWWNTCSIDRGSKDGIATDMAVVTEKGLVGKVTTVSRDIAIVLLISDESLRVSIAIEGTQEQGIISGTRASSNLTPDLRIRFLSKNAPLKPGMKVITAGTGGVFPTNLLIGEIKDFTVKELEGVATVSAAVDLADVKDVFVIAGQK